MLRVRPSQLSASAAASVTVFPLNQPPVVSADGDKTFVWFVNFLDTIQLTGSATDNGLPPGSTLAVNWSTLRGPNPVVFSPANAARC